jgi:multidrug transporter EmrE-like cation transporter
VHAYDIYDLVTTKRKSLELARYPAIPFSVAFVLSVVAFALRRARRDLIPIALFAVATFVALVAFNVSMRQRNALLAPLAVLGGVGVAEIVALARARSERSLLAFGAVMIAVPLLGIEGTPMKEDAYNWWSWLRLAEVRSEAFKARERGERARSIELAAAASILDTTEVPLVSDQTLVRTALAAAEQVQSPERLFDVAIALEKAGAWREAEAILSTIAEYRPRRENRAISSVAYYRARAAARMRAPLLTFRAFIDQAERETPGDPHVLALRSVTIEPPALPILDSMHDPFTRDYAVALALADIGETARADAMLASLEKRFPEWTRPAMARKAPVAAGAAE